MRLLASALLFLPLLACGGDEEDWRATFGDPGSPFTDADGVYRGPTVIQSVYLDCIGTDGPWEYGAYTYGWAADAEITVHQWYPDTQETHPLPSVDRGDDQQWDHRFTSLQVVPPGTEPDPGATALGCDWSFYTWRIRVWQTEDTLSDCVVFGYDPARLDPARTCRFFRLETASEG